MLVNTPIIVLTFAYICYKYEGEPKDYIQVGITPPELKHCESCENKVTRGMQ